MPYKDHGARLAEAPQCANSFKAYNGSESIVRVVCASLSSAAPELLLFFSACKAQLLDC
jgi:hypothetical protein